MKQRFLHLLLYRQISYSAQVLTVRLTLKGACGLADFSLLISYRIQVVQLALTEIPQILIQAL